MSTQLVQIIDDDADSRLALCAALRKGGFTFLESQDGESGIRLATERSPDLIILDIMMPKINGYEVLRQLRERETTRRTPVLIISALGSMEEKIFALESGADGLLAKPFDREQLVTEVEELLGCPFSAACNTIRQRRGDELVYYHYTDVLTGVPNRSQLIRDIRESRSPGLVLADIDGFKDIVYFYGHRIGDACLRAFVARLKEVLDADGYGHYRIGADTFAVLIPECQGREEMVMAMDTIERAWRQTPSLTCCGQQIPVWVTTGGSVGGERGNHELLSSAEKALKTAKKTGKSTLLFDEAKAEFHSYEQNIHWANRISKAIAQQRIVSYFQPIVNNANGRVEKYECLVRLIEQDGRVVPPGDFLEVSKRTHHYAAITSGMVAEALRQVAQNDAIHFTINLSARDMIDPDISDMICEQLESSKACDRVMFELLESEGVENYDAVYAFIERVKGYGCRIAIDDFGAGYSNFIHMIRLNVDVIKIDGSLIRDLDHDDNARVVVETIVSFAKRMGVQTVAEFVHSESIHRIVKELGVDYSQGFYLGKPKESV